MKCISTGNYARHGINESTAKLMPQFTFRASVTWAYMIQSPIRTGTCFNYIYNISSKKKIEKKLTKGKQ